MSDKPMPLTRGWRYGLQRLKAQLTDGPEIFDVPSHEDGMTVQGSGCDQRIGSRDGVVVDEDIRIDQVAGYLGRLAFQTAFPLFADSSLIRLASRQAPAEQPCGLGHNAVRGRPHPVNLVGESHGPFDRLQLIFKLLDLFNDVCRFHGSHLLRRSFA